MYNCGDLHTVQIVMDVCTLARFTNQSVVPLLGATNAIFVLGPDRRISPLANNWRIEWREKVRGTRVSGVLLGNRKNRIHS